MNKRAIPYSLRLPREILDWLHEVSKQNSRSSSSEVMFRLNKSLEVTFLKQDVAHFKQASPTKKNDESFGLRVEVTLKEALKNLAKINGNSLNQEIVMRLFFATKDKLVRHHGVQEGKTADFEDIALMALYKKLSPEHKQAVMTLIRNLS